MTIASHSRTCWAYNMCAMARNKRLGNLNVRDTPYSGLYGEVPPKRGAFFKLAVNKRAGKITILVYERVAK